MNTSTLNLSFLICSSFLVALLLSVYPLPMECRWWRPEFVLMVAIYWVVVLPFNISLTALCALGLFQDLLEATPFGQHSLGIIVVAYLCLFSYQRLRNFNVIKQMLAMLVMISIAQLTDNWVQGMAGRPLAGISFIYAAISSAICWPLVRFLLVFSGQKLRVFQQ
jgi:rod shape-determining protein MreD